MKLSKFLMLIFLSTLLTSCYEDINLKDYIDRNSPLTLEVNEKDKVMGLQIPSISSMAPESEKFEKFIQWSNANIKGWQSTPASYSADLIVRQGDFHLLHTIGSIGVVVGFKDKYGKEKQYTKTIKKGDLDFLLK